MTIREILARRDAIRTEMRGLHEAHPEAMPDAAAARWTALEAEATALNAAEARAAMLDDLDRRAAGTALGGTGTGDSRLDVLAARVSFLDVCRAQMGATDAGAGRAREVSAELARRSGRNPEGLYFNMGAAGAAERRDLTSSTPVAGPGGNLIQTIVAPTVIDRLREKSVVRRMGAQVIGGLTGNLALPRLKTSATA